LVQQRLKSDTSWTARTPGRAFFKANRFNTWSCHMSLGTILLIILVLALIGAIPNWGYSSGWGYGPSGLIGTVLIVVLILVLLGRL
jgi:uncharacterized membrane protein YkgB